MVVVRILVVGLLLAMLAGCVPPAAGEASPPARGPPSASVGPALSPSLSSSASPVPSANPAATDAFEDPAIPSVSFPAMSAAEVCALLESEDAIHLLGQPLEQPPGGISEGGRDADCIWQTGPVVVAGTYLKIDFNQLGFAGQATLINLHRDAHTLRVAGFEAIGSEPQTDPVIDEALLSVKVASNGRDPALWVEAPTSAIAEQVALLVLPRLALLH